MADTSTVPAFKAALIDALDGNGFQVAYGFPGVELEAEGVYLGDVAGDGLIATMKAGRKSRDENYRLEIRIHANEKGGGREAVKAAETRGFELLAYLEDALADDPSVGGIVNSAFLSSFEMRSNPEPHGAYCTIDTTVNVFARLN